MKETLAFFFFIYLLSSQTANGQTDSLPIVDPIPKQATFSGFPDSIPTNTRPNVPISPKALDEELEIGAKDSMILDNAQSQMHLFGDAFVKYEGMELKAGYIVVDFDSNTALAQTYTDSIGQIAGRPAFSDGSQNFEADKMRYNFKSQKGLVFGVSTTQSNLFLKGTKTKFVSKEVIEKDSTSTENILYNQQAIFSTCDLPHPHYGIRSKKQKVIANKVVVAGPSNLEIGGVPTPIYLPFGFFPLKQFKSTGLIFPEGYEYSPMWGFGLDGVGWYFPINDYLDLKLLGQIYWHGTWGLQTISNYRKRYKYSGSFNLAYSSRRSVDNFERTNSYSIRWSHNQDAKAHPARRLTGSVNIQGNSYQSINNNDARSVLQNQLSSNVTYNQSFPGKPFRLSASMSHSQNTRSRAVNISLPRLNFQMDRIYPFKKEAGGNKEKWYEKVSFRYTGEFQNRFTATDTTLFTQKTLEDARFGFKHDVSTDLNFNLLKYINVSPNVSYKEVWNFHTIQRNFDPTLVETDTIGDLIDTTKYGTIVDTTKFGFKPFHELNSGVSFNTILYGTMQFKKGRLKGLRHTVKPSFSFNYIPNYTKEEGFFGGNIDSVDTDSRLEFNNPTGYNIFQGGVYGTPPSSGLQMLMSYSINNIFEAKYFSRKDSTDKKIKIFDNIRMGGNYNFAADSLKFSTISANGTTRLLQGITTFNFSATWDPYAADANNRRINQFYWKTNGKLLRFTRANFRLNSRISVSALKKLFKKSSSRGSTNSSSENTQTRQRSGQGQQDADGFLKFLEGFNLNHSFVLNANKEANQRTDWTIGTHSLNVTISNIQLTKNWSIRIGNIGYDFKNKRTTYPDFGITRDLHCWVARFSWQPQRGTYFFTIKVKNPPLDAIKIPYSKNNADAFGGF